jgi:hypothetical protein
MAVQHGYGKVAGADALVFAYDTGDTRNSYKGEPTTNIVTNPTFLGTPNTQSFAVPGNWYFSGDTSATGFRFYNSATAPIPLKFPNEGAVITTGSNATTNRRIYYNGTVEPNTTYTLSYWLYSSAVGSITNYFFTYKADGTGTTSPTYSQGFTTGQWVFIQHSFTTPADTGNTRNVNWGPVISSSVNSLFAMQRFQVEAKSHATQFVNGTRSATQGLLDLTGNSSIDLTNLDGYNANAEIDFDGTNDKIRVPHNSSVDVTGSEVTFEQVIKKDTNGNFTPLHKELQYTFRITSANQIQYSDSSGWSYSGFGGHNMGIVSGNYFHMVTVKKDGVVTIYVNNLVVISKSWGSSITSTTNDLFIGAYAGDSNFMDGQIPVTKIYNRALTAAEVANNYNHYKGRFNI